MAESLKFLNVFFMSFNIFAKLDEDDVKTVSRIIAPYYKEHPSATALRISIAANRLSDQDQSIETGGFVVWRSKDSSGNPTLSVNVANHFWNATDYVAAPPAVPDPVLNVENDEFWADVTGATLARVLRVKKDPENKTRWDLEGGNKSNIGLARTALRILRGEW